MVSLEFYLGRKRLSIEQYCTANGIDSFVALCENLHAAGVVPPPENQVAAIFFKPKPVPPAIQDLPALEPVIVKSSKRKEDVQ
jgi:hypothetical protein